MRCQIRCQNFRPTTNPNPKPLNPRNARENATLVHHVALSVNKPSQHRRKNQQPISKAPFSTATEKRRTKRRIDT